MVLLVSLGALSASLFPIATWARILPALAGVAGIAISVLSNSSDSRRHDNWMRFRRYRR